MKRRGSTRALPGRCLLLAAVTVLLTGIVASASLAAGGGGPGLDRSYGRNGIARVDLATLLTPPAKPAISGFAPAADGTVFVLLRFIGCRVEEGCGRLFRFDSDGVRDSGFGADGSIPVPGTALIAPVVDSSGKPVVASPGADHIRLVRFLPTSGRIDPSFGGRDGVSVRCRCQGARVRLSTAPGDKLLVEVDGRIGDRRTVKLIRLLSDGRLDPSFGGDGSVSFPLGAPRSISVRAVAGDGAIYLGGSSSCCGPGRVSVLRVSPRGRLDARFTRTEARSAHRLNRLGEFPSLSAIVPRPDGSVDLLGDSELVHGFDLRLRADGRRQSGFGTAGLALFSFLVESAVLGRGGGIVAVGTSRDYRRHIAFRETAGGRLDTRFGGSDGIRLKLAGSPAAITALAGRRVLVTDIGNLTCRGDCEQAPAMARLIEP